MGTSSHLHVLAVREILPELLDQIIQLVSSSEVDQQEVRIQFSIDAVPAFADRNYRPQVALWESCVVNLGRKSSEIFCLS